MVDTNSCTVNLLIRKHEVGTKGAFRLARAIAAVAFSVATSLAIGILEGSNLAAVAMELQPAISRSGEGLVRSINEALRSATYWDGADGAMTVELSPTKTLWLFGDTLIAGGPKQGHPHRKMINNSVAIQDSSCDSAEGNTQSFDNVCIDSTCWSFWHRGKLHHPESVFAAEPADSYYWPGCGTVYDGKLYLLMKKIRKKDNPDPLFQFDWYADDLLIVSNPQDPPNKWVYTAYPLATLNHEVEYGLACTKDNDYFYSLCFLSDLPKKEKKAILARISWKDLLAKNTNNWQYWSDSEKQPQGLWEASYRNAKNIIPDCGPEASLFFHRGLNCFVAVFQPPLSPEVKLRVARKIEGPWSETFEIYKVPARLLKDGKSALSYAGKAHESLSSGNTIGFSYCENPGGLEQHVDNPGIYFPTVRSYTIEPQTVREMLDGAGSTKPKP